MQEKILFDADQMVASGVGIIAPADLNTSHDVFAFYSKVLAFPDYFGWNWDAFDECLKDLSWIGNGPMHIIHNEIPIKLDTRQSTMFLSTIHESKFYSRTKGKLFVHFRMSDKHCVLDALFKYYRGLEYCDTNRYLEYYRKKSRWNEDPETALRIIDKGLAIFHMANGFLDEKEVTDEIVR